MKQLLFFVLLLFSCTAWSQNIPAKPNPPRLVNDFAHVLNSDQVAALERKLVDYDDSTSTQVVVVTVETTGDYPLEDYALKILREWGVGNKKTNNGVVLLAAIRDRKVRIETGYGLEGAIPDITAKQIIESKIVPNFRNENYYAGFDAAVDDIIKAAAGEYKAPDNYNNAPNGNPKRGIPLFAIIFVIIVIIAILSRIGGGGGGGGMMSRSGFLPWLIINSVLNSGGRGGSDWGGGGGGGWSGGGGGGGFGGFGGGSGGGGGASGGW